MENVMKTTVPTVKDLFNENVVNDPKTIVSLRFAQLNIHERTAIIELGIKSKYSQTTQVKVIAGRVTKRTIGWFSYQNEVKDAEGNGTGTYLSGYQKFLQRKGLPVNTPISEMDFQCENHSEDYYENPFKVSISKTYNSINITRVTETNMKKQVTFDPANPDKPIVKYIYKRNKEGHVLTLNKENYRRVEMR